MKLKDTFPHIIAPVINKNTRINAFIISICLFIIIIIWAAVTFQLRFEKKEAITAAIQQNSKDAIAFEQYVLRTVESIDAITKFVKIEYQRNGKNTSITKLIADQAIDTTLFRAINIMDEKGNLLFTSYTKLLKHPVNVFNEEHFQVHLLQKNDKIFISRPLWSENFGLYIVTLTRRINKSDGTFGGIISIPIDPARFTKLFVKATLPPHYIISLVRFDGITIARLTGGKESSGENIIKSPLFNYIKKQPNGNYFAKDVLHGIPTYFSYRTLQNHPLLTTVGTAEEDVLAAVNHRSKWDYISAVFGTLIIIFFTWLLIRALMRRKLLEEKLIKNETRFRSLIENNNDAIVLRDKDFKIFYCSPAAERIINWTSIESLSKHFATLIHPDDMEIMQSVRSKVFANPGKPVAMTGRLKTNSGNYIWAEGVITNLLNDNNVNAIISNFRDITERKKAEEEIKERLFLQIHI